MEKYTVGVAYDYYSDSGDVGNPTVSRGRYTAERSVRPTDSVRNTTLSVIREAIGKGIVVWPESVDEDSPVQIYLESDQIRDAKSGYDYSRFGIRYGIAKDGSIIILDGYSPLRHDWTFAELEEMVSCKYLDGNPRRLVVGIPEGLGGDGVPAADWVGFIADMAALLGLSRAGIRWLWRLVRLRSIRKTVRSWQAGGIEYPHQLREFTDTKGVWELAEFKKRLKLDDEWAIFLLTSLGYEPTGNNWKLTHSKSSIKLRKAWLRNEHAYVRGSDI